MGKMDLFSRKMEVKYGPDTADLNVRVGIHSGPVTGGFMKGKGARFQLFGDTMTTTSLIHSHGESGRIHISEATASILLKSGKKRWVHKRDDRIWTEAKGELVTYWLSRGRNPLRNPNSEFDTASEIGSTTGSYEELMSDMRSSLDTERRWVDFNTEVLGNLLKQIIARRETNTNRRPTKITKAKEKSLTLSSDFDENATMPIEEVKEIIDLPEFDKKWSRRQRENLDVEIPVTVVSQLREYVTNISKMYNKNPFHNFAHASYVVMAVSKYLRRIIAASEMEPDAEEDNRYRSSLATLEQVHEHTYGITSDPLTQFACVFSALIHDVDHPGVPNPRLIAEDERIANVYKNRSVAEQKSFDLSWDLLMEHRFEELRGTICQDMTELRRFRQLVINSIMATDLGDRELKALRNRRWDTAFKEKNSMEGHPKANRDVINRKATIVIEHLIQAADIAHTCQHWNIYRKWNQRLFEECYEAYRQGRAESNPADSWYKGELGFYDFYIIPLSKKLRDCGVFGPTSDENLNYATNNRAMWEKEGEAIVADMIIQVESDKLIEGDEGEEDESEVNGVDGDLL